MFRTRAAGSASCAKKEHGTTTPPLSPPVKTVTSIIHPEPRDWYLRELLIDHSVLTARYLPA